MLGLSMRATNTSASPSFCLAYQTPENFQMQALLLQSCSYIHPIPELERRFPSATASIIDLPVPVPLPIAHILESEAQLQSFSSKSRPH